MRVEEPVIFESYFNTCLQNLQTKKPSTMRGIEFPSSLSFNRVIASNDFQNSARARAIVKVKSPGNIFISVLRISAGVDIVAKTNI